MLIRELEKATGLERATIRYYEKEGFIAPHREENGYRTYSDADRDMLLKIKLLRQLGISLEKIRALQQGSLEFSVALAEQIRALEKHVKDTIRAKEVCGDIRRSGASFDALDAQYYLNELTKPAKTEEKWIPQPVPEFHRYTPVHPWRRFLARFLDILLLAQVVEFVVCVVLRIRPINSFIYTVIRLYFTMFLLLIPLEGLLLHYWGTTPGKWIFGIRVESVNGGNLSFSDAMVRAWNVLRYGCGLTIPIYNLWRLYKSYRQYNDNCYLDWDEKTEAEFQFEYCYAKRKKAGIALIAAVALLILLVNVNDAVRPVHRGAELTVAQIAENYNDLVKMLANENNTTPSAVSLLTKEGKWGSGSATPNQSTGNVIEIGSHLTSNYPGPEFSIENGAVRKITYRASYKDILMLHIFSEKPTCLALSVAMSQDWMSILCLQDFSDRFIDATKQERGTFTYRNLEIVWNTVAENCTYTGSGFMAKDLDKPSSVDVEIEIYIH